MRDSKKLDVATSPQGGIGLRDVSYAYDGRPVLKSVNLEVPRGAFVSLLGPSGCGKSTLLRLVAGLLPLQSGRRFPETGSAGHCGVGICFQDARLLSWRTCVENVSLALEAQKLPRSQVRARAVEILQRVGLGEALRLRPAQLSGGMKMRVALARALVTRPSVLLLDEPFAALDEPTRASLQSMLYQRWSEQGMTVLLVTHSLQEAARLSQETRVMGTDPDQALRRVCFDTSNAERLDTRKPAFAKAWLRLQQEVQAAWGPLA